MGRKATGLSTDYRVGTISTREIYYGLREAEYDLSPSLTFHGTVLQKGHIQNAIFAAWMALPKAERYAMVKDGLGKLEAMTEGGEPGGRGGGATESAPVKTKTIQGKPSGEAVRRKPRG